MITQKTEHNYKTAKQISIEFAKIIAVETTRVENKSLSIVLSTWIPNIKK